MTSKETYKAFPPSSFSSLVSIKGTVLSRCFPLCKQHNIACLNSPNLNAQVYFDSPTESTDTDVKLLLPIISPCCFPLLMMTDIMTSYDNKLRISIRHHCFVTSCVGAKHESEKGEICRLLQLINSLNERLLSLLVLIWSVLF